MRPPERKSPYRLFLFFDFDEMASARLKASIRASVEAGEETQKYATNAGRYLSVGGRKVQLLRADGTATPAGAFYYEDLLNIERPKLYAYESPLIDGKWVQAFDGSRVLVRRKKADGTWEATKQGEQYFRHAKDEWIVHVHERPFHRTENHVRMDYAVTVPLNQSFTVPYLTSPTAARRYGALATDAAKKAFVRDAALAYMETLELVVDKDGRPWRVVVYQSIAWVWDPDLGMEYSIRRTTYREEGAPSTETILNRPLRARCVPDACWRPWDLHPNCLQDGSDCAVRMLLDSHVVHKKPGHKQRKQGVTARTTAPARTREQIEADLDAIFAETHAEGAYPFERGWREDGVTSVMLLA